MRDLFRLIYCSESAFDPADLAQRGEIDAILQSSRRKNVKLGVTGVLVFGRGGFVQVLEGPRVSVERVFELIQCDPRHDRVQVIDFAPASSRHFGGWAMGFVGGEDGAPAILSPLSDGDRERLDADGLCRQLYHNLLDGENARRQARERAALHA